MLSLKYPVFRAPEKQNSLLVSSVLVFSHLESVINPFFYQHIYANVLYTVCRADFSWRTIICMKNVKKDFGHANKKL